jgi:SAM-dependent methyltransferase
MTESCVTKLIEACAGCGGTSFEFKPVIWDELAREWGLSKEEVRYIDRQQGVRCTGCGNTLRSIALARAVLNVMGFRGYFLDFIKSPQAKTLRVLEINEAGTLTRYLAQLPRRELASYPEVDMQRLPYAADSFDLVIHSDTLEHVAEPATALSECLRVLKPEGFCCFTIPIVVGRLTRSRAGLPNSYHGAPENNRADYIVQTEYGGDFWTHVFRAGFTECRIVSVEFPSAQAIAAQKSYR